MSLKMNRGAAGTRRRGPRFSKKNPSLATGLSLGRKHRHSKSILGSVMCRNSHMQKETLATPAAGESGMCGLSDTDRRGKRVRRAGRRPELCM
jgi:hypothetical protein